MKSTGIFSLILLLEQGSGQVTDDKTFSVSRDITIMRLQVTDHDHNHAGHLVSDLAGAGGMLVSSVAAGLAVNSQWFAPAAASGDKL